MINQTISLQKSFFILNFAKGNLVDTKLSRTTQNIIDNQYMNFNYDVIVIGGGHAGCEAAAAAARMGAKTCLITMDMNKIGQMSCNPAVGGIAKGQIVREIDALGGEMGLVTDATSIQFRMLNRGKGPAVWSPRAQCDRGKFIWEWRSRLDHIDGLDIWQDEACELLVKNCEVVGVETVWGVTFHAKAVVITAGTFLNGLMHVGRRKVPGGRCAEPAVLHFTESIYTTRHKLGKNEDGNTGAHRPTLGSLRGHGVSTWRYRLPRLFVHDGSETLATTSMLDNIHQQRGARHAAQRHCRLPTLQRADQVYRSSLLSVY